MCISTGSRLVSVWWKTKHKFWCFIDWCYQQVFGLDHDLICFSYHNENLSILPESNSADRADKTNSSCFWTSNARDAAGESFEEEIEKEKEERRKANRTYVYRQKWRWKDFFLLSFFYILFLFRLIRRRNRTTTTVDWYMRPFLLSFS